jgi:hypothetical protein
VFDQRAIRVHHFELPRPAFVIREPLPFVRNSLSLYGVACPIFVEPVRCRQRVKDGCENTVAKRMIDFPGRL